MAMRDTRRWDASTDSHMDVETGASLWDAEEGLRDTPATVAQYSKSGFVPYSPSQFFNRAHSLSADSYAAHILQDPAYMTSMLALLQGTAAQEFSGPMMYSPSVSAMTSSHMSPFMIIRPENVPPAVPTDPQPAIAPTDEAESSDDTHDTNDPAPSTPDEQKPVKKPVKKRRPTLSSATQPSGKSTGQRKRVCEMTAEELRRVRESNRITAKRNRAKMRREKEVLVERLREADEVNRQLSLALKTYQERKTKLLALVSEKHRTAVGSVA